jgi:drug/metabolite transporter (DMT)-like permease
MQGLMAVLLSPMFLGFAPVFGKLAYLGGSDPFTVAATRTVIAAAVLWIVYSLFARQYIYIYPAGFLGCVVVGTVNGVGSLFYYNGLSALNNASVAQLLNATYLIFVVVLVRLAGHRLSRRTLLRALLALVAVMLLTGGIAGQISWLGAGLMVGNAILFAGTIILSQRVLYEMPSPTVTLYVITTMAVVVAARATRRSDPQSARPSMPWWLLRCRADLFVGVKLGASNHARHPGRARPLL